jgi:hypothetical protein
MIKRNQVLLISGILLVAVSILVFAGIIFGEDATDLKIYDSTVTFRHFDYKLNPDNTMKSYDSLSIIPTVFKTKVIENIYLKVTLLPDFGGRILSIIYKPTGHEELYQNPIGTPYGMKGGSFYYDWLMVYGGIFPTFPEPEHGKTWCLPWETKIATQTADQISVEMKFTDNIAPVTAVPKKFNKGKTDMTCIETVSVFKDKPYVKLNIKLINNHDKALNYEYWTCTTLTPGSESGKTLSPANSEMVVPIQQIEVKDDWWPWMGVAEDELVDNHVFGYKKLAIFGNWKDMGIAYAHPGMEKEWWGVINHENEEGIFRIANNKQFTPGLKFWTWGYKQGTEADIEHFGNSARAYIELWAGNSHEFFANAKMAAGGQKSWDEYYIPTVGIPKVTFANLNAFLYLDTGYDKAKKEYIFNAKTFTTHPGEKMTLVLRLTGIKIYDLGTNDFTGEPAKTTPVSISKPAKTFDAGKYSYELVLKSASGDVLAQTGIPVEIKK